MLRRGRVLSKCAAICRATGELIATAVPRPVRHPSFHPASRSPGCHWAVFEGLPSAACAGVPHTKPVVTFVSSHANFVTDDSGFA